ncbi:MAG: hypothetical protein P8184_21945 [Calditrichia bacterium]
MRKSIFWIFGIIQSLSLAFIIFLIFDSLSVIKGERVIGLDAQIVLSIIFPLFLLIVEFIIFTNAGTQAEAAGKSREKNPA